ncbi:MAG TPA: lipopolysaccharide biosynthesis protein [Thermoanaerobaculia bacterium]|nr:lipopolysaccharide biosynthesis protein [Thermoanaerobaculia bacterium]
MSTGRVTARAAVWAFVATAGAKFITLVGLALLARLLAPREFGMLAFAMVYITYAETIGDLGSGMALVYWPDRREDAALVTFWVNALAGAGWCVATFILAPWVADFFNAPNGAPIVRALGFSFIIRYLGNAHDALSQKDMRFRARLLPEFGLAAIKAVVSLVLAWMGFGAWSLVWGHLAGVAASTIFLWAIVPWRPSFRLPMDLVKPMLGYGRGIIIVNVLAAVTHHADLAVVGRLLGTTALGLYQMATKVPETTIVVLLWVMSKVLFPAFSRMHADGQSLRTPYLTASRYISAVTLPASVGLLLLARPVVLVFLGDQWLAAAPILGALSVFAGLRALSTHAGDVLKATGRAKLLARLSIIKAIIIVPGLLLGAKWGATGVAWGLSISTAAGTLLTLIVASRVIRVRAMAIIGALTPSSVATAVMAVPVMMWVRWAAHLPAIVQALGGMLLGAAVYALVLALLDRDLFRRARAHFLPGAARTA